MATITTKPDLDVTPSSAEAGVPAWPREQNASGHSDHPSHHLTKPSQHDALQALLAFSALHDQVRRRRALAVRNNSFDAGVPGAEFEKPEFEKDEQFVLDEVLQLVAERAVAITGADGLAIALAENSEIVLRAAAGTIRPDVGARIDRDSAFSGACFKTAQVVNCDDTETDPRVNLQACRKLGARSMVAVPLCGRRRVIGLLEAFSSWPFGFNDSDIRNLSLLAELVLGALKPEDEDRFAESAQAAANKLETPSVPAKPSAAIVSPPVVHPASAVPVAPVVDQKIIGQKVFDQKVSDKKVTDKTIEHKPVAVKIDSAPAAAILNKPATEKTFKVETKVAAEHSAQVKIAVAEPETASRPPVATILLVCIVIAAAFAGGVWWKLKTAQLSGAMIQGENIRTDETAGRQTGEDRNKEDRDKDAMAAPANTPAAPANSTTAQNPASAANPSATSDAFPDGGEPNNSPATAQELSKFPRVTGVRHWSSPDSSTVVLDLQDQVQYEAHRLAGPDRIYFDLRDTQLATELLGKSMDVGETLVSRIRMAQPVAGMTRVVLETKANSTFSVSLEPNPYRLVVEVRKIGATPKAAVNLFPNAAAPEKKQLAIVIPPPTKEDLQLRARVPKMRIVVDAGHGGWDLGTVGRRGLLEKDLVLEIAQRLGKLLESRLGMEVIYTRQDDNYIPLDERASIANQSQADLFVSVHANYSDLPSARGVETYYTNFFSAPGTKDVDTHVTIGGGGGGGKTPATTSLSPADLHERIEQSRRLAASVQRSLYGTLSIQNPGLRDRGIKEAGFVVLTESAMPGILAEVSFVSSPTDEQKLRSDGYREQIAEALYRGIARYAASSHSVKVASAAK
jgi:N-acetylmuramoyl-L-alanine amidase